MRLLNPLLLVPLLVLAFAAQAVVEVTGDGSGNTTAPSDDPGFANVGVSGNALTGVYLGNRWVLSARHVGEQSFRFGGVTYPAVVGSLVHLQTSPGVGADLEMVRILGEPPLPAPTLSSGSLQIGETVVMIGNGWNREATQTCWNGSFTEVSCPPPGPQPAYRGYKRLGTLRTLRWGRNVVVATGDVWNLAGYSSISFETLFDASGVADEAMAVPGDSGGPVFVKRGGQWELAGIMFAETAYANQPADTAMFGQSTLSVDLYPYRAQIDALLNPPVAIPLAPPLGVGIAALLMLSAARLALSRRAPVRIRHTRDRTAARRG